MFFIKIIVLIELNLLFQPVSALINYISFSINDSMSVYDSMLHTAAPDIVNIELISCVSECDTGVSGKFDQSIFS